MAALTPPARQVHLAVLAAFAETSRPPARGELERTARAGGADPAAVLAERDVIAFDAGGEIRAACPFSPTPTPIRVSWEGGPVAYAMCAIDALGISAAGSGSRSGDPTRTSFPPGSVSLASRIPHGQSPATASEGMTPSTSST